MAVAYVSRVGGTKGGLLANRGRSATYTKLIDVDALEVELGVAAATIVHTDTVAIARIPVGSYVSNVSAKPVRCSTIASGTVSVGVTGTATQFLSASVPIGSGDTATLNVPVLAAYTTKYACTTADKDILLTFNTAHPHYAKFLVSWTIEDTDLIDPVTLT
jgi:hypothetical protein